MPVVDGSAIQDFEPMEAGVYDAILSDWSLEEGPKGQYYKFEFTVTEDPYSGRKQWRNVSITPSSLWAFKSACLALGAENDEFEGKFDTDEVLEPLRNSACRLKVSVKTYEGKESNQVDKILGPSI